MASNQWDFLAFGEPIELNAKGLLFRLKYASMQVLYSLTIYTDHNDTRNDSSGKFMMAIS